MTKTLKEDRKKQEDRYKSQNSQLKSIETQQKSDHKLLLDITNNVSELNTWSQDHRSLTEPENIISLNQFCQKYNIVLPFEDMAQFEAFELRLTSSPEVFAELVRYQNMYKKWMSKNCFHLIILISEKSF